MYGKPSLPGYLPWAPGHHRRHAAMVEFRPARDRMRKSLDAARQRRLFRLTCHLRTAERDAARLAASKVVMIHTVNSESIA